MGRRSSFATVASGVDSSPSSAETSFRELEDVFLQTQARIWLGEVLKIRMDEQLSISDLLADGELLFEVSKTVWSLLLEKCVELRQIKPYQSPLGSRKSSGKYKPYSNVDSFLKVCKILGLNGIDLFSPSDVVEKRNTRKVCICIRAISKKARSKQLNVPDFDSVTYSVVMPTDMVGCIRRSLESSQCSVSSCSSSNSYKQTSARNQLRKLTSSLSGNYDSCSEESDEVESAYFGIESYSSSTQKSDHPALLNLEEENSPGALSAVKQSKSRKVSLQSDMRNYYRNGKPCLLQHSGNDHPATNLSTCYLKTPGDSDKDMHTIDDIRDSFGNMSELAEVDHALCNDDSEVGDSISDNIMGSNFISDYLAFSDSIIIGNNGASSLYSDGEDNVYNFFTSIDSHGLDSNQNTFPDGFHHRTVDDMEDVEVSSTASMSSILGRALNMDFDDQYNGRDSSMAKVHPIIEQFEKGTDSQEQCYNLEDQTQYDVSSQCSITDIEESHSAIQLENEDNCTIPSYCEKNGQSHCRESHKLNLCGDSRVGGIPFSTENIDMALAETESEKNSSETMDLKKAVIGVSDINPNRERHSSDYTSLNSLYHKVCMEATVPSDRGSLEENENCICSLECEDVPVEVVPCPELYETQKGTIVSNNSTSVVNECESETENYPIPFAENERVTTEGGHQSYTGSSTSTHNFSKGTEDYQNEKNADISMEKVSDRTDQKSVTQQDNPRRKSLLNTFVTGTALIGVLFFLLHIRKRKEQTEESVKAPRFRGAKPASQRERSSRSNGIYPADKLKFGN